MEAKHLRHHHRLHPLLLLLLLAVVLLGLAWEAVKEAGAANPSRRFRGHSWGGLRRAGANSSASLHFGGESCKLDGVK